MERTLAILKPDAVARNLIGEINRRIEEAGFKVVAMRMMHLSERQAREFYAVHRDKPFYEDLVRYMTSGPVVVEVLEREDAVSKWRELMGATDPKKAAPGTIRADFGTSIEENVVHGSDSLENAQKEIHYFFGDCDIYPRTRS